MSLAEAAAAGLDPRARRLLAMTSAGAVASGGLQAAAARRAGLRALTHAAGEDPDAVGPPGEEMRLMVDARPLRLRRYRGGAEDGVAVLFLHGGGFVAGDLDTHDALCRRLSAAAAADVFALDYPLAPEHPHPAALDAAIDALGALVREAPRLGLDPARLGVAGDSAGGALAAALAAAAPALRLPVKGQLLICPILDLVGVSASRRRFSKGFLIDQEAFAADLEAYAPAPADRGDPRLSPLLTADLSRSPPAVLGLAQFDPFCDEGLAFAARLIAAGVRADVTRGEGLIHYYAVLTGALPAARQVVDGLGRAFGALLRAKTHGVSPRP